MPRILDETLDCAIYLYEDEHHANMGTRAGGSGFIFGIPSHEPGYGDGPSAFYAVSNWHVVVNAPTIRLTTAAGESDVMSFRPEDWIRHPDEETDLAVRPLRFGAKYRNRALSPTHLVTREKVAQYNIGIGDDVFAVGRFIDQEGEQRNQPSVRFGAIAQIPGDPIPTEVGRQDAYLAEIRSIAEYSGAPVIALIPGARDRETSALLTADVRSQLPSRFLLLGIDCRHFQSYEPVFERDRKTPAELFAHSNTGMAIVIAAWKLEELLNSEQVKRMRANSAEPEG